MMRKTAIISNESLISGFVGVGRKHFFACPKLQVSVLRECRMALLMLGLMVFSACMNLVRAQTTPGAPTALTATAGINRVLTSFTVPANTGGAAITNYQYSTDNGTNWTAVSPASTATAITITGLTNCTPYDIKVRAVNNVGAGEASSAVSSTPRSGIANSWISRSTPGGNSYKWNSVTYGNGLFVAVTSLSLFPTNSGNRVMTSPDGITWISRSPTGAPTYNWTSVTYGNGVFVAVANNNAGRPLEQVMTSPDGTTWTIRDAATRKTWSSVTFGNGLFVAVAYTGTSNNVMTSPDGITWTSRTAAAENGWTSVTYANGLFVAVSNSGSGNRVMTSPDGITWTSRTSAADNAWASVTYGGGLFVAVATNTPSFTSTGQVMTSPDGFNWTSRNSATYNAWNSVTYGGGLFVAVASSGTDNRVMTSSDGFTWTISPSSRDFDWRGVTYGGGLFVAVSSTGDNCAMTGLQDAVVPDLPTITGITPATTSIEVAFTDPADAGGSAISNYEYSTNNGSSWTTLSPASATSPMSITGLTEATAYQVKLRAVNGQGSGCISATTNTTTTFSLTWNGSAGTDWNTAANWTPNTVPSAGSSIIIPSGLTNYPVTPSTLTMGSLTVTGGNYPLGASIFNLTGGFTNNGAITGTGRVVMGGTSAQTISGTGSISNIELNNPAGVSISSGGGNMQTITGKLTPTSGTLTTNGNLTLRSDINGTARVGQGDAYGGYIIGDVITQRYFSLNNTGRTGRAWRLVTIPVRGNGRLQDMFMGGQWGTDLTVSTNRSAQPANLGTVVIGHNYTNASDAIAYGFDWIGVANQVSSLRYFQQNATTGSFASSQVPNLFTDYWTADQGYMLFARGDRQQEYYGTTNSSATTLQATGELKQGTISVMIPDLTSAGYVLVGNPYMSVLDLEQVFVDADNNGVIESLFYVWDANIDGNGFKQGGYRAVTRSPSGTWTATGSGANPQFIESGSAFFVKPTSSGGMLSIKEAHKVDGTPGIAPHSSMTDGPSRLFINLEVTDMAKRRLVDGAVAFFDTNYKDGLGDAVDIAPMTNLTAGTVTLRHAQGRLSMEGRPWPSDSAARTIPVDMRNLGDDAYVLHILPTNMNKEGFTAWLKDRHLNKETALKTDNETLYPFRRTGDLGIDSSRFEIVYRLSKPANTGTLTPDDAAGGIAPRLYPNPSKAAEVKLSLGSLAPGRYEVQVVDMSGRLVLTKTLEHLSVKGEYRFLQGRKLSLGTYIIRISDMQQQLKETLRLVVE